MMRSRLRITRGSLRKPGMGRMKAVLGALFEVIVVAGEQVTTHALPEAGSVSIGRGEDCDLRIDHGSVSRRHALLHIGPPLRIEDLGSANGTFVCAPEKPGDPAGTQPMRRFSRQSVDITVGEQVNVGAATLVVRRSPASSANDGDIVLRSSSMRRLYEQAERAAQGPISVLLLGETGVGKEVLARVIHQRSPRVSGPFLGLNCAALSDSLLESELFGHEKGAFTGAAQARPGLFESADGGTVFLDEIGELPMVVQVKLLRVLEERAVLRVGGRTPRRVDVRFISATHRDLEAEVARGTFREDLFYRLNGIALQIPPLRERTEEIAELSARFAVLASRQLDRAVVPTFAPETLALLQQHAWPGNVRELRNVIERAIVLCTGATILPEDLPTRIALGPRRPTTAPERITEPPPASNSPSMAGAKAKLQGEMADLDRRLIVEALERCGGNQTKAAELLGISRRTLVTRLGEYQLPRPRKRD
ncbi:Response regulator of zinc sigma-54-dependent two-component system [Minicystis rosea]|nr:Response regulator of zinc sigma-54-dependent two-component system [Minicystis rosea]